MIFTELDIIDSLVIGTINDLKYVVSLDMDDYEAVKRDASRVVAAFVKGSDRGAMTEVLDAELAKMNGGQVRNIMINIAVDDVNVVTNGDMVRLIDCLQNRFGGSNIIWGLGCDTELEAGSWRILCVVSYA